MPRSGYADLTAATRTARDIEYEAIARCTRRLVNAQSEGAAGFALVAQALHHNRLLWATFAQDVASGGNALPQALRAQIFYLAEFTDHHTRKVLAGLATLDVLIEVNTAVMRGLRGQEASG